MSPETPEAPVQLPVTPGVSAVAAKAPQLEFKSKTQVKRLCEQLLPGRRFRIMTKPQDLRAQGHEFAILEEVGTNGELVFRSGAPNLNMVGNFFKAAVEDGRIQ